MMAAAQRPPLAPLTRDQILVTAGIMSAIAVAALDVTVVGTAMPTIIGQLGGLSEYGWVFSAYLLASTTTVPLYVTDRPDRTAMLVVGTALLTQLGRFDALAYAMLAAGVTGLGMGLTTTTLLVIIQGAVAWQRRAVATGLVQFSRTIGGAVGVGLMGGILTAFVGAASSVILDPIARSSLSASTLAADRASLADGLGVVYWLLLVAAIGAFIVAVRAMPDVVLGHEIDPRD